MLMRTLKFHIEFLLGILYIIT